MRIAVQTVSFVIVGACLALASPPVKILQVGQCHERTVDTAAYIQTTRDLEETLPDETINAIESCHFQVLHGNDLPTEQVLPITQLLELTHDAFYGTMIEAGFIIEPIREPLFCITFSTRNQFDRYALATERRQLPWLDGYYSPRTNRILLLMTPDSVSSDALADSKAVQQSTVPPYGMSESDHHPDNPVARITHEAAHQLAFNCGLQKRGVMYPFWLAEGLATTFEDGKSFGPNKINTVRRDHLLKAWHQGRLMPLEDFLTLVVPRCSSRRELNIHYAQAWGLFHYLFNHHPRALKAYLTRLAEGETGRRTLLQRCDDLQATLPPIRELQAGWSDYLRRLESTSRQTADDNQ